MVGLSQPFLFLYAVLFAFHVYFVTWATPNLLSTQKSSNKFGFSFVFS